MGAIARFFGLGTEVRTGSVGSAGGDSPLLGVVPPARAVLVHDWIWSRGRGDATAIVSWFLLKKVNLIKGPQAEPVQLAS